MMLDVSKGKMSPPSHRREAQEERDYREEEFCDFLTSLLGYAPTVPESVVCYQLAKSGVQVEPSQSILDERITRLVSLAADKFLAEIVYDARQHRFVCLGNGKNSGTDTDNGKVVSLETSDVAASCKERGIHTRWSMQQPPP